MSHPNPKLIDMDFTPPRERRGPTAMPNPTGASGSDEGVTGEIRSLMDQLQQTANEARHRLQAVQDERDALAQESVILQDQARDLRSRAAESNVLAQQISRLEHQKLDLEERLARAAREAAQAGASASHGGSGSSGSGGDLPHRLAAAEHAQKEARRQHDEIVRQRDELSRSVEALNRTVHDLNTRYAAGQNQLLTLRQARDASQNQNRELTQKISDQEDALADLQYRLEKLEAAKPAELEEAAATATAEDSPSVESALAWAAERDELRQQVAEAQRQESMAREELAASVRQTQEHAETELQLANAAHESALAEVLVLQSQVERLRQQGESGVTPEALESLRRDREAAHVQAQMATREVLELRGQLQARASELAKHEETRLSLVRTAEQLQAQFAPLAEEREVAVRARDEALTSLASAQKQIERVMKERDLLRDQGTEHSLELESQVEEWRHRCQLQEELATRGQRSVAALDELRFENRELSSRLDAQRLETIELATRLQSAQDQVRSLSATLAEARLQAKAAGNRPEAAPARPAVSAPAFTEVSLPLPATAKPSEPFPTVEAHDFVRAMRRCYNAYARDPEDLSHLNELHCAAHSFAEAAREGQCIAVSRVGVALATLVQELYHFPEQITAEVLTSIVQSIEFLTAMLKVKELRLLKDPANGTVCVIDDDSATRECLIMAMETVMVNTIAYREPSEALCGLAKSSVDLIVLDVQMPGMDGFELCSQIRQHSLHQHTPVIFVTGQTGPEVRERCALCGGNDFLTKPFILAELGLKSLILMVRAELHLA